MSYCRERFFFYIEHNIVDLKTLQCQQCSKEILLLLKFHRVVSAFQLFFFISSSFSSFFSSSPTPRSVFILFAINPSFFRLTILDALHKYVSTIHFRLYDKSCTHLDFDMPASNCRTTFTEIIIPINNFIRKLYT